MTSLPHVNPEPRYVDDSTSPTYPSATSLRTNSTSGETIAWVPTTARALLSRASPARSIASCHGVLEKNRWAPISYEPILVRHVLFVAPPDLEILQWRQVGRNRIRTLRIENHHPVGNAPLAIAPLHPIHVSNERDPVQ